MARLGPRIPALFLYTISKAASQNTNDNSDGWDNSGDWGEPTQDPPKMVETKKQDSWGEFEDWLSDEKSTAKKD